MSSVKDATKTVKDTIVGVQSEIEEAKDNTMDIVDTVRRRPFRRFITKRISRRVNQ